MERDKPRRSRLVRTIYIARAYSFAFCFVTIGVLCHERGAGAATWVFLALTFLVYPHLAYLNARSSPDPRRTEHLNLLLDALILGVWAAQLGFPLWIVYPLISGTVGPDVLDIRKLYNELGIFTYDPGFGGTASCDSRITYIDGDEGILLHRGYPIQQLAEQSSFLEVAYLLLNGELPNAAEKNPSKTAS